MEIRFLLTWAAGRPFKGNDGRIENYDFLARELDLSNEFQIFLSKNLIPANYKMLSYPKFKNKLGDLDAYLWQKLKRPKAKSLIAYVGDCRGICKRKKAI